MKIFKKLFKDNQKINASEIAYVKNNKATTIDNCFNNLNNLVKEIKVTSNQADILIDGLDMVADGGKYFIEAQIVTSNQNDFNVTINGIEQGYYHMAVAAQSSNSSTAATNIASQYYEYTNSLAYWMHGSTLDVFPSKLTIELSFNALENGKKLINYHLKYVNAQSGNNQLVNISGQQYYEVDNLTSFKISASYGDMKFKKGTIIRVYRAKNVI